MRVLTVDPESPDPAVIDRAARALRTGRLVAFPTETVYGLGADALDDDAVRRIFEAKERPPHNPLIVHAADADAARGLAQGWPSAAERLADAFWPGPLTLVLPKRPAIPDAVTAGLPTVAVRVPSHPVARMLLRAAGVPVAAPSANPFTGVSPTTAEHVRAGLADRIDIVLDAGPTPVGIESTVVDLSGATPRLLRPGMISPEALERVVGRVEPAMGPVGGEEGRGRRAAPPSPPPETGRGVAEPEPGEPPPRPAPGMLRRHYAPRARVRLFDRQATHEAETLAREAAARDERIGALLRETELDAPIESPVRMPADPDAYARELYAALHRLDAERCELILVEDVPDSPDWAGIRDRLLRATS